MTFSGRLLIYFLSIGFLAQAQEESMNSFPEQWAASSAPEKIELILRHLPKLSNTDRVIYLEEAIPLSRDRMLKDKEAELYLRLGQAWYGIGNYPKTLDNYQRALSLYETMDDKSGIGRTYNELATFIKKQKDYSKALEYLDRSRKFCSEAKDTSCLATSYNNRGLTYAIQNDWPNAEQNYHLALELYKAIGDTLGLGYTYASLAEVAASSNDITGAIEWMELSTEYKSLAKDQFGVAINITNTGELYFKQKKYKQAIEFFERSTATVDHVDLQQWNHRFVSRSFAALGETKKALDYLTRSYDLKDSLLSAKRVVDLAEMETKYETEKKEQTILVQQLDLENQKQKFRTRLLGMAVLLLALIGGAFLIIYRNRQKQKILLQQQEMNYQNQLLHNTLTVQEQERKRIAKDLHDGIGQQLTGLKMSWRNFFERIAPKVPGDEVQQFNKMNSILEAAAEDVRSISHQMMPRALQELGLIPALEDLVDKAFSGNGISCEFDHHGLPDRLPENTEIQLYRVVQELVNNLLKHANATEVGIQIFKNKNQLIAVIEDNGIGFQVNEKNGKGHGLLNINSRLSALNGQIDIQSAPGKGTINTIKIPLA